MECISITGLLIGLPLALRPDTNGSFLPKQTLDRLAATQPSFLHGAHAAVSQYAYLLDSLARCLTRKTDGEKHMPCQQPLSTKCQQAIDFCVQTVYI